MVLRACPLIVVLVSLCAAQSAPPTTKYSETCIPGQYSKDKPCTTAPHATYMVDPEYAESARRDRIQGTVVLQVKVSKDGRGTDIKVLKSVGHGLDEAAIKAVSQWKYQPATLNGEPVEVVTQVTVNFRLSSEPPPPPIGPVAALDAEKLFAAASSAQGQHDCTTAVALATRVTEIVPTHKDAWNLLGLCYIETGDLKLAENALKRQIEVSPDHLYAYNNLGRVYLRTHEYDRAIALFRRQLEINPQDRHAHQNLGHALRFEHKCEEAIEEYKIAAGIRIGDPLPHIGLAECYFELGNTAAAIAEVNQAAPFISGSGEWNELAWTMAEHKADLPRAEQYARSAIAIDSAPLLSVSADMLDPRVYWTASHLTEEWDTLGWILYLEGKPKDAEKYLLPAWQWSQSPTIAAHLATLYTSLGKKKEAITYSAVAVQEFKSRPELMTAHLELFKEAQHRLEELTPPDKQQENSAREGIDSFSLPNTAKVAGTADFAVVQDSGSQSANARWMKGSAELRPLASVIADHAPRFQAPADVPVKIVRWGTLKCESASTQCVFQVASLHQAMVANKREPSVAKSLNPTPHEFSSPTLGVSLALAEGWQKVEENAGNFNHAAMVRFSKPDTIAYFIVTKERIEVGQEDFEHIFRYAIGNGEIQRHWSEASVQRDGVPGARFIVDYERADVNFRAMFELFTVGDLHVTVLALAPADEFARYAADFKAMFESLQFAGSRLAEKELR